MEPEIVQIREIMGGEPDIAGVAYHMGAGQIGVPLSLVVNNREYTPCSPPHTASGLSFFSRSTVRGEVLSTYAL
jgi:hypothetical protein